MRKKKDLTLTAVQDVQPTVTRGRKPRKASSSRQKNTAGSSDEEALDRVKSEYADTCKALAVLMVKHERMLKEVKHLRMLLAAFNALTLDEGVKLEKPADNTPYWYLRVMPTGKAFEIVPCSWKNWGSDFFRYVQGNMFLDLYAANVACTALNRMLFSLSYGETLHT